MILYEVRFLEGDRRYELLLTDGSLPCALKKGPRKVNPSNCYEYDDDEDDEDDG